MSCLTAITHQALETVSSGNHSAIGIGDNIDAAVTLQAFPESLWCVFAQLAQSFFVEGVNQAAQVVMNSSAIGKQGIQFIRVNASALRSGSRMLSQVEKCCAIGLYVLHKSSEMDV
jgi:hypothetical protein